VKAPVRAERRIDSPVSVTVGLVLVSLLDGRSWSVVAPDSAIGAILAGWKSISIVRTVRLGGRARCSTQLCGC